MENIIKLILENLSSDIIDFFSVFYKNGYEAYLVGGFIRDVILNSKSFKNKDEEIDIDVTTSASPEIVMKLFKKVIPTGLKHGTVTVIFKNQKYEVTTYRIEQGYKDNRHPDDIQFVNDIRLDLSRRDFTINSIAFDPLNRKIVDPFNGIDDIKRKIIKTVGDPDERFSEDSLRILRAIRFSTTLMFEIEEKTFKSISKWKKNLRNISVERIRDEFNKLLLSNRPSFGIELLRITGLLEMILPDLEEGYGIKQNEFHKYDIYYHNLYTCDATDNNLIMRLAGLLHDVGKTNSLYEYKGKGAKENVFYNHEIYSEEIAKNFLTRFKYPNKIIDRVIRLIKFHMFHYTNEWSDGAVRRFVKRVGEDLIDDLFALRVADRIGNGKSFGYPEILIRFYNKIKDVIKENHALKITDLDINGYDLMERFNLKPSRMVGNILNHLLEKVLDNPELNNKEKLMELAEKYLSKVQEV